MKFKNSNYLVVLAGSPRGGEDTWNSLFKYVIEHLEADLAICTTDNFLLDNRLFNEAKFKWIMETRKTLRTITLNIIKETGKIIYLKERVWVYMNLVNSLCLKRFRI